MTDQDLARTRAGLHAVGELLLAGPQHRSIGTIRLRVSPGGFRTWAEPVIAVVDTDLRTGHSSIALSGRSLRALAAEAGVDAGAPVGIYSDGSGADLDDEVVVEPRAAARITGAFEVGDAALRLLSPDSEPVLWPEHFDVGIRVDDVNYGVSPGDAHLPEPYAYVGVDPVPAGDPFWNAPFGRTRPMTSFADAAELHDFFAEARERVAGIVGD